MARTQIRGQQILDGSVKRKDLNVDDATHAVIRRIIAGDNITISSTGANSGTGDVTINAEVSSNTSGPSGGDFYEFETTDNTQSTLAELEIEEDTTETFLAILSARGPSNKNYWATLQFSARRNTSENASIVGDVVILDDDENSSNYVCNVDVDAENVRIRVTGANSETVTWQVRVYRTNSAGAGSSQAFEWSTSEQEWPFEKAVGGDTIYCKEIAFGAGPNATTKNVAHNISGFDISDLYRIEAFGFSNSFNDALPVPYSSLTANDQVVIFVTNANITMVTGINFSSYDMTVRIWYKK